MSNDRFEQLKNQARAQLRLMKQSLDSGDATIAQAREKLGEARDHVSTAERFADTDPTSGDDLAIEIAVQRVKIDADEFDQLSVEEDLQQLKRDYESARNQFIELFGEEP